MTYQLADGDLISQTRGGSTTYYLPDGQGSTRALADASGAITDTYNYDAFGEISSSSGTTSSSYLYTRQQFDDLTGLYSLRARYYDPGVGRFLSRDVADILYENPLELNRYVYAANSPIAHGDPSGLSIFVDVQLTTKRVSNAVLSTLYTLGYYYATSPYRPIINFLLSTLATQLLNQLVDNDSDQQSGTGGETEEQLSEAGSPTEQEVLPVELDDDNDNQCDTRFC